MTPISRQGTCPVCRSLFRERFDSEEQFIAVSRGVNAMVDDGRLSVGKNAAPTDQPLFPQDFYLCTACGTSWVLSHPDQAYRGFLKPIEIR